MLYGCINHTIISQDIYHLQTGSPLRGVSQKTFVFKEFKDARDKSTLLVGKFGLHKFLLDEPATTVVAMAIKKELERNGHRCITDSAIAKDGDFIVEGTVYEYSLKLIPGFYVNKLCSKVVVKLTIRSATDKFSKTYQGEYSISSGTGYSVTTGFDIINQAFLKILKDISIDSDLVEFLGK